LQIQLRACFLLSGPNIGFAVFTGGKMKRSSHKGANAKVGSDHRGQFMENQVARLIGVLF
jgi:hypothetical protein